MKKYITFLIILVIVYVFIYVIYMDWKTEGYSYIPAETTEHLKNCFELAENYKKEKLGPKYELYGITYEMKNNTKDEITFIYTKRHGFFKDVYFVIIDRRNNALRCSGQAEANRLYGRDLQLEVNNWTFDFDMIYDIGENFVYDQILFESRYENEIMLRFINQNKIIFSTQINVLQ